MHGYYGGPHRDRVTKGYVASFLALELETRVLKCFDNFFRGDARQARHTYEMVAVRTVMPSETGSAPSSSGIVSPCSVRVSR
jgi:hypothetical protein